jgi:hypothetical protein
VGLLRPQWKRHVESSVSAERRCSLSSSFRHLSRSIGSKQDFLSVNLTVKLVSRVQEARRFKELEVPETIEWE